MFVDIHVIKKIIKNSFSRFLILNQNYLRCAHTRDIDKQQIFLLVQYFPFIKKVTSCDRVVSVWICCQYVSKIYVKYMSNSASILKVDKRVIVASRERLSR